MSDAMELKPESLEQIGAYVRRNLPTWLREVSAASPEGADTSPASPSAESQRHQAGAPEPIDRAMDLNERAVRVEEELKSQRELMRQGFAAADKRVDELRSYTEQHFNAVDKRLEEQRAFTEARFNAVDKRLEEQRAFTEARFNAVDKRFEDMHALTEQRFSAVDKRFEDMHALTEQRFSAVDKRFENMHALMEQRFNAVDKRFEDQNRHINRWMTVMTVMLAIMTVAITTTNLM